MSPRRARPSGRPARGRVAGGLAGAAPVFAALVEARRWLDHIEGQWDEALSRLKASLERET